jgi:hypothetical protein
MSERTYQVGEAVKGTYFGQPYQGVVSYARPHTMNNSYKHHIALSAPITVFGTERDSIIVSVWDPKDNGNTISAA